MSTELKTAIDDLAEKARKAETSVDALNYSQAAVNLAHAAAQQRQTDRGTVE